MKAMILAAGRGTRLLPLTNALPKILIPVYEVPMLERLLAWLGRCGVREAAINTHHLAERVAEQVEALRGREGMPAPRLFHEPELLGTGGALVNARAFWGEAPLLVWNGDVLAELDPRLLVSAQRSSGALATLVTQKREEASYLLADESGRIVGIEAARHGGRRIVTEPQGALEAVAFNGVSLLSPALLPRIERPGAFDLIDALLEVIADGGRVEPFDMGSGFWGTTGTLNDLTLLERQLLARRELMARFTPR